MKQTYFKVNIYIYSKTWFVAHIFQTCLVKGKITHGYEFSPLIQLKQWLPSRFTIKYFKFNVNYIKINFCLKFSVRLYYNFKWIFYYFKNIFSKIFIHFSRQFWYVVDVFWSLGILIWSVKIMQALKHNPK